MILVLQAAVMLAAAIAAGRLARAVKLPAVIGELFAGILLGPTWLDLFPPASPGREVLARIGLICFLFVAGLEVNLQHLRRHSIAVALTSLGGIALPFASAVIAVRIAPSIWRQSMGAGNLSLFLGAALAISALPVIARIILDLRFERLPLASVILASATIDDLLGWILFVIVVGGHAPEHAISVGAFLLGAVLSPRVEKRDRLRQFVIRYLAPFFFVSLGLRVDFISNFDWLLVVVVIVIASIGKIAGVTIGARLGGFSTREAAAIGMAMNARGAVEMVLASVALQAKLIDSRLFVALVVMAVVTTVIAGPSMQGMLRSNFVSTRDVWRTAESYEAYIGRWSRLVARDFVSHLPVRPRSKWLEVGCGSGALTDAILSACDPMRIYALDRSFEFVLHSRTDRSSSRTSFVAGDAAGLPFADRSADAAVSALVLNFVSRPEIAVREMLRCVRPGGLIAVYVWDYSEGMQLIRSFWDAAVALNPAAAVHDEANRFPLCRPAALQELFERAGAADVRVSGITVPTIFERFEELWAPFLGGQGPAPTYVASLPEPERSALREQMRRMVPTAPNGSVTLAAKAWVVRGIRPTI